MYVAYHPISSHVAETYNKCEVYTIVEYIYQY